MTTWIRDAWVSGRTLVKARAFTLVCVTSLGVGMGVVIGLFLLMRMVTSTPPVINEDGLVELVIRPSGQLKAEAGRDIIDTWSYPDYLDIRDATRGLVLSGWSQGDAIVRPPDQAAPFSLAASYVSSNYFSTVGVTLPRGPGFTPADDGSRAEAEAVISHRTWQIRFGSDPNIIGRHLTINQSEHVIVGVAPEGFRGHFSGLDEAHYQLWLPLSRHPRLTASDNARLDRHANWVRVVGRLMPGTTVAEADAAVHSAMATLAARDASSHQEKSGGVEPYFPNGARLRSQVGSARLKMLGLAGMVLLVVGLNVSGMMLVRSALRERELAIRLAMGASRWRLVRYHLTEALVMALLGGGLASALLFGVPVVVAWAFDITGPALDMFRPDVWIALQCVALCFVTSLVLGALPAIRFSRPSIVDALKNDSSGGGRRVGRLQRFTAAAQAGIAVPFLVLCGLQLDQARATAFTDTGFTPRGLYAMPLDLTEIARTDEERRVFLRTVQETLSQAAGVSSVSVGDGVPLDARYRDTRVTREGDSTLVAARATRVGARYLETIGTRLLAGRMIDANDREGGERVVVLSEPLARQLFPGGDPLGRRIAFALAGHERFTYTVIGVAADLVSTQMDYPRPQLFVSLAQHPATSVFLVARGAGADPAMRGAFDNAVADGLRASSGRAAADLAFRELVTGEGLIDGNRKDLLISSAASGIAAAVALLLAALGVYGVIAFMVATRTREIGVRVALGASRARVVRDVLGDALLLVVPGIGLGLLLAVASVRLTDPTWYAVGGVESLVYALAAAVAFTVAVLAGIPSARRAAAVQPIIAMRSE